MKKLLLFFLFIPSAFAMSGKDETMYSLSSAGGIVNPSYSTSVFQNPAAITRIPRLNLNAFAGGDSSFGNPTVGGGLGYGGGTYGIVGGISSATASSLTVAYFGLGAEITSIKTAIGVSGTYGISPSGGTNFNAGILFTPVDKIRLGFTAIGLNNSILEWGGGLAFNINPSASLLVDASADNSLGNLNFKPGLLIVDQNIGATLSYGFGNASSIQIMTGFSAGAFAALGKTVKLELYYRNLQILQAMLTVHLM